MAEAALQLQDMGCAVLSTPCNTAHAELDAIAEGLTSARFVNMLDETAAFVKQLGVTKSHLVRVFKQEIGVPPGKYLTNIRIEAVKSLLLSDEYNLETIAGLTGFSGANYLCRVFKREVGISPAAWRTAAAPRRVIPKLPPRGEEMFV